MDWDGTQGLAHARQVPHPRAASPSQKGHWDLVAVLCFTVTLGHTQGPTERQKLVLERELLCQRDGSVSKMDAAKAAALSSVPKTTGWEERTAPSGSCLLASTSTAQCAYSAPNTKFTNVRNTQGHLAKTHPESLDTQILKACGI